VDLEIALHRDNSFGKGHTWFPFFISSSSSAAEQRAQFGFGLDDLLKPKTTEIYFVFFAPHLLLSFSSLFSPPIHSPKLTIPSFIALLQSPSQLSSYCTAL
jgi:hypothetical protein